MLITHAGCEDLAPFSVSIFSDSKEDEAKCCSASLVTLAFSHIDAKGLERLGFSVPGSGITCSLAGKACFSELEDCIEEK